MAWCWGANFNGQLGNNSLTDSRTPVPVDGGRTYRSIAVGKAHTCAIGTDNVIYCWGNNRMGQLGSYFVTNPKIPNPTAALVQ
jgi:alpha-tubulin suppressor-like RCC1 family protein